MALVGILLSLFLIMFSVTALLRNSSNNPAETMHDRIGKENFYKLIEKGASFEEICTQMDKDQYVPLPGSKEMKLLWKKMPWR